MRFLRIVSFLLFLALPVFPAGCSQSGSESEQGILDESVGGGGGGGGSGSEGEHAPCGSVLKMNAILTSDLHCGYAGEEVAIEIAANDVTFDCKGYTIHLAEASDIVGIRAQNVDGATIRNCTLEGGTIGIHLIDVQAGSVTGNAVFETGTFGIFGDELESFSITGNTIRNTVNLINGIEIFDSEAGTIAENEVAGCGSGIDLYGSSDISILENIVFDIGDTGLGFFDSNDVVTHDVTIRGNDVYNCGNVGAAEIMYGSHQLTFLENHFHDSSSGVQIYDGNPSMMHDLAFESNRFTGNEIGLKILGDTYAITVIGNEFLSNDTALVFENSMDIDVRENTIDTEAANEKGFAEMLRLAQVEQVRFNHNVILGYESFLLFSGGESIDLSENHWNGCPRLSQFDVPPQEIPPLINPINPLPCYYNSHPITWIDENEDGEDDFNCQREEENECIE